MPGEMRTALEKPRDKVANLAKRPDVVVGDAGRMAKANTFDEAKWRKKWRKRLK